MALAEIKVKEVLADLERGMTRTSKDKYFKPEIGCIQDKYNLNGVELKTLFSHAKLKGKKVKIEREATFTIIDDTTDEVEVEDAVVVEEQEDNTFPESTMEIHKLDSVEQSNVQPQEQPFTGFN